VLHGLRQFARRDLVCETTGTIADAIGASTDTVRRGLAELVALALIEPTGLRAGKARQLRLLVGSPQPLVGSPQAAAQEPDAGAPVGGPSASQACAATRPCVAEHTFSPMATEDRRFLDEFEWTPELRRDYAHRAAALALHFAGGDVGALQLIDGGSCIDCVDELGEDRLAYLPSRRYRLGRVTVCGRHATKRLRAAVRVSSAFVRVEAEPEATRA
jgi:hypothetical protein